MAALPGLAQDAL